MLKELRVRVERFYERATREQIQEATRVVQSLLAVRGLHARASFEEDQLNPVLTSSTAPLITIPHPVCRESIDSIAKPFCSNCCLQLRREDNAVGCSG
jgi:hypothetical protein